MNFRFIGPTWQFSSRGPSGRKFWAIDQATDGVTHTHTHAQSLKDSPVWLAVKLSPLPETQSELSRYSTFCTCESLVSHYHHQLHFTWINWSAQLMSNSHFCDCESSIRPKDQSRLVFMSISSLWVCVWSRSSSSKLSLSVAPVIPSSGNYGLSFWAPITRWKTLDFTVVCMLNMSVFCCVERFMSRTGYCCFILICRMLKDSLYSWKLNPGSDSECSLYKHYTLILQWNRTWDLSFFQNVL